MYEFLAGNISLPNNLLEDLIRGKSYAKLAKSTLKRKLDDDSRKAMLDKYRKDDQNRSRGAAVRPAYTCVNGALGGHRGHVSFAGATRAWLIDDSC